MDRDLIEDHLMLVKGICDLYLHGAIESSTAEVHAAFQNALKESLNIQNKLYNIMSDKGWYTTEQVEQQKINTAKQQYAGK